MSFLTHPCSTCVIAKCGRLDRSGLVGVLCLHGCVGFCEKVLSVHGFAVVLSMHYCVGVLSMYVLMSSVSIGVPVC